MGDLYIYLVQDGKSICFQRFPCSTFNNNNEMMIVKLVPDFAVGTVSESRKAGILKLEINIKKTEFFSSEDDLNSSYNSINNVIQLADANLRNLNSIKVNDKLKNHYVVVNVYQSRYLVAGDNDGTSDPYVKVKIGKQTLRSTIKNDTVNPVKIKFLLKLFRFGMNF